MFCLPKTAWPPTLNVMKTKLLLIFALLGLCIASAKTYEVTITAVSQVGNVQLQPGKYDVAVDASTVRFTGKRTRQTVETTAKVEKCDKKFAGTEINSHEANGTVKIDQICLGGSSMKLQFE